MPALTRVKQEIIRKDPYERVGLRPILNLGHSLAHALEGQGWTHGLAVRVGLCHALWISTHYGGTDILRPFWSKVLPERTLPSWDSLRPALLKDKLQLNTQSWWSPLLAPHYLGVIPIPWSLAEEGYEHLKHFLESL
jgi:hypothetical protein